MSSSQRLLRGQQCQSVDADVMLLGSEYNDINGIDSGSVWVYRYKINSLCKE